jgi:hypothetical protein
MYIFRPIIHNPPFCSLKELQDGTYNINDLADFHEMMDVEAENIRRAEEAQKRK